MVPPSAAASHAGRSKPSRLLSLCEDIARAATQCNVGSGSGSGALSGPHHVAGHRVHHQCQCSPSRPSQRGGRFHRGTALPERVAIATLRATWGSHDRDD